jgi:hypothetical protein
LNTFGSGSLQLNALSQPDGSAQQEVTSNWIGQLVFGVDLWLRRRHNIVEYSNAPHCLFRIQRGFAEEHAVLSDATEVVPGDPVLCLHFWNEHIPAIGPSRVNLDWARRFSRALDESLYRLWTYLAAHHEFDDIEVIRGDMRFGSTGQEAQLARLSAHYGFEPISQPDPSSIIHRVGENVLILLLAMATNPRPRYRSIFRRDRQLVYLSRRILQQRYGRRGQRIRTQRW